MSSVVEIIKNPEFGVVILGVFLLMLDAFAGKLDKRVVAWIGVAGLAVLLVGSFFIVPSPSSQMSGFYLTDPLALFFKRFMLVATILTLVISVDYAPIFASFVPSATPQAGLGEFFTLPIFTCAGLMWLVSAADFIMIFVSLELVTISFYVLVASMRRNTGSLEAGVKYLILGALSTGFIVYGITWIFGMTGGQTNLLAIREVLPFVTLASQTALLFGLALVLVAVGFKVAAFPFQFWIPDVYQGAPTPVTAYLSVASKAAGFVVLLRVVEPFLIVPVIQEKLVLVLTVLAAATLVYGNFAAMPQTNLKRLLAYSSVAHAGYLLVGVASLESVFAGRAVAFYLAGYLFMTFLAFVILVLVARVSGGDDISDFNGLGKRSPELALAMVIAMVSLAGLPFTVGFLGKFFIFEAALSCGHYVLVTLGAISVACGFYYYLKVVRAMYWQPAPEGAPEVTVSRITMAVIIALTVCILVFGFAPQPLFRMLQ